MRSPLPADTARLAWRRLALVAACLTFAPAVRAQVAGPDSPVLNQPAAIRPAPDETRRARPEPLPPFLAREGSGTSWLPDETPMFALMRRWRGWDVMLHASVIAQVAAEDTTRHRTGGDARVQASSTNWGMAALRRPLAGGRVGVRAMLTAEPWTVGDCGFLNLLATGETCDGDTIHDRQHPHDALMELAADYSRPLGGDRRWHLYAAASGEPALGPGGFPHRLSAMANPGAPIGHHWLDATHVSFGVVTAGVSSRRWRAEASAFNGREPDERRAGLELAPLDSLAARLAVVPSSRLALQVSAGHLREAEAEPGTARSVDIRRVTASATYHRPAGGGAVWATTAAWGLNDADEAVAGLPVRRTTHAALVESAFVESRQTWVLRAEVAGKPAHDLHAHEFGAAVFTVGKVAAGYTRYLAEWRGLTAGLGVVASAAVVPRALAPRYGGRVAPGAVVFAHVRPVRHAM